MIERETMLGERVGIGRTAEVYALGDDRVVKVLRVGFPDGLGLAEAAAAAVIAEAVAAAPRFFGATRISERYGLVYERLVGRSMLDRISARPWIIGRSARAFAGLHAAMHASDGQGLPDQKAYYARMIELGSRHLPGLARAAVMRQLEALPAGSSICHGDMHPGNVIVTQRGPVVIDWLTAGTGSPAADVARTMFLLRESAIPSQAPAAVGVVVEVIRRRFAAVYLAEYRRLTGIDEREIREWRLPILAARLGEEIEAERSRLLALIARELADAAGGA